MLKTKKILSIIFFILMMFLYCILVMTFLIKINFNKDKLDDLVYQVYDQDWSEWNDFIAFLIDNEVTWS